MNAGSCWKRLCLVLGLAAVSGWAQEGGRIQKMMNDLELVGSWTYADLPAGFAEAKKTGKPLLAVLR